MEHSETIKNIAAALVKFNSEVETIKKDSKNPFFQSKYASLDVIIEAIKKPLESAGLSYTQFPVGKYELCTMLMHTSGEWMKSTYVMEPEKKGPQGAGMVITYQRRYALSAVLGS